MARPRRPLAAVSGRKSSGTLPNAVTRPARSSAPAPASAPGRASVTGRASPPGVDAPKAAHPGDDAMAPGGGGGEKWDCMAPTEPYGGGPGVAPDVHVMAGVADDEGGVG